MLTFEEAVIKLKNGDLVIIPTETVYGLAASIYHYKAIKKIFYFKNRPFCNPLIVHIGKVTDLYKVANNIPDKAWKLVECFFPGPLTLILEKKNIFNLITAGSPTVGIRMPNHPLTLKVIQKLGVPIAAPSANLFNYLSPTSVKNVQKGMPFLKDSILDGGRCKIGIESTVLGFIENKRVKLFRHGAIAIDVIESVLNEKLVIEKNKYHKTYDSPGMGIKHYSPKCKLIICHNFYEAINYYKNKKIGILSLNEIIDSNYVYKQIILSVEKNLFEAANKFFSSLYLLDSLNLDIILVKKFPNVGLGISLNDRLERASTINFINM